MGRDESNAGFGGVGAELLEGVVGALLTDFGEVLVDGGEPGCVGGSLGDIVEADQTDVVGDRYSFFAGGLKQSERHVVVSGERGDAARFLGEPQAGGVAGVR